jgi:Mn2+/Fe2+ NRAMP family transporter
MIILVIVGLNVFGGGGLINVLDLSKVLPIFGKYAEPIMGLGFIFAGFLALVVVSLGSAWGVLEATGRSTGSNSRKNFMEIYAFEALPALLVVAVISGYIQLMLSMMFIFPIVLIPSLFFLGKLVAKREVMNGFQFKNRDKALFWAAVLVVVAGGIIGLTAVL